MKYTKQQRLDIGRRIYEGEITKYQAAELYGVSDDTARKYMRMYRDKDMEKANAAIAIPNNNEANMKYSKEERLEIGQQIYEGDINKYQAAEMYGISEDTARKYMRMYRDINYLPPKHRGEAYEKIISRRGDETYDSMSKDQLIKELIQSRMTELELRAQLQEIKARI